MQQHCLEQYGQLQALAKPYIQVYGFLGDAKGTPLLFSGLACISLGTEKIRLTLDYQSEGRILLHWVLWIPVFKNWQVKVRELWKQVLKREKNYEN